MGKESISRTTFVKGLSAGVVVAASLGMLSIGDYSINGVDSSSADGAVGAIASPCTPGTYTASAAGISSDVTVTATFDETGITSLEADVSGETAGIGAEIGDEMVEKVLAAQSADVDGVSGATVTSTAFKEAVADVIAQATGESSAAEETSEAVSEEAAAETETADTEAGSEEAAETENETAAEEAAASADGVTYTASAAGISSDVTVSVTFDGDTITAVTADVSGETAGIGAEIGDEMCAKVLEAQSADVDGVSNATVTSTAFKDAVANCIEQASGGAAVQAETEEVSEVAETEAETEEATEAAETEAATEEVTESAATEAATEEATEAAETEAATEEATEAAETEAATEEATEAAATEAETEEATEAAGSEAAQAADGFTPGTYTASAAGISSDVTVTATFDESGITEITADVSGETAGIGADIGDAIIQKALKAQSSDIDGIAGATITSTAFKTALADCIEQAGFSSAAVEVEEVETEEATETEVDAAADAPFIPGTYTASAAGISSDVIVNVTFDENNIIAVGLYLEDETPEIGGAIGPEITQQLLDAQSADVDGVSGATVTSDAVKTAFADCIEQAKDTEVSEAVSYTPGTYTATTAGISSDVVVTMTFDENGIIDMDIDVSGETASIGAKIGDDMLDRILKAQSADVDGISGATVTSNAVKAAAADCFAQAGGASAEEAETETEAATENE
jgi:uncharacterized protein with FMN-binding domain